MLLKLRKEIESLQASDTDKNKPNQSKSQTEKERLIADNKQLQADLFSLQKVIVSLNKSEQNNKTAKKMSAPHVGKIQHQGKKTQDEKKTVPPNKKRKTNRKSSKSTINKVADFCIIEGVGPKIDGVLKAAGIYSMENLSKTKVGKLQEILKNAGGKYNFAVPDSWPKQAALAAAGKMEELQALQDELLGGKTKPK